MVNFVSGILAAGFVAALLLTGCDSTITEKPAETSSKEANPERYISTYDGSNGVTRIMDKETGVLCYLYNRKGISCIPTGQFKRGWAE